ncbi:TetR/AcrR family transcriptional regulator [Azospirillum humicireducens]|uniref:TetR/AcrR family transcriptional regulator n=1 Tax=Azospirillum humicireducens TaxID=1226968 RepID=A0A160JIJ6_9PROT|nr:TetR/AcrR family transcriptional regulator [Azospirillum humicireducens]ANC92946.1 TetR/AcrR family transcriptional regulator [Azospirillum humicireducens]
MPDTGLDEKGVDYGAGTGARGHARCRALLDAAAALFVEKGYAGTSLSDILRVAGGSRTTLYAHFGDKDGLFRAMMDEYCARVLDGMAPDTLAFDGPTGSVSEQSVDPEERLVRIALHIMHALTEQQTTAILRTLISEGARIPDLAETFVRVGPERIRDRMAGCLRELAAAGRIRVADADVAAQSFCGMVTGNLLMERLILPDRPVDMPAVEAYVRASVSLFLRGTAPPRDAS